jgi:hypothetical protein
MYEDDICDEFSAGRYSNLNFQTQKKHHQTLTEKLLSMIKQCKSKNLLKQIHTNAYKLNTKTQFPSFQNR